MKLKSTDYQENDAGSSIDPSEILAQKRHSC